MPDVTTLCKRVLNVFLFSGSCCYLVQGNARHGIWFLCVAWYDVCVCVCMLGTEHGALCMLVTCSTTELRPSSQHEFNTFSNLFFPLAWNLENTS